MHDKELRQRVRTKFSDLGLTDAIINGLVEHLGDKELSEQDIDGVLDSYMPLLKAIQSNGDRFRELKTQNSKAIKELEELKSKISGNDSLKSEPKVDLDKEVKVSNTHNAQSDLLTEFEAIKKSFAELKAQNELLSKERIITQRKAEFDKILSPLPDSYKKAYRYVDITSLSDEEFTKFKEEVSSDVSDTKEELRLNGLSFSHPSFNRNTNNEAELSKQDQKMIDDVLEAIPN